MTAVIQRVSQASVSVDEQIRGEIGQGFLVLLGVEQGDAPEDASYLASKIAGLRVFEDEAGKMNRGLLDIGGEVLLISNFTLCADCRHGKRPSFTDAARPEQALPLYEACAERLREAGISKVEQGVFGADMKVSLLNDGPVTLILESKHRKKDGTTI